MFIIYEGINTTYNVFFYFKGNDRINGNMVLC